MPLPLFIFIVLLPVILSFVSRLLPRIISFSGKQNITKVTRNARAIRLADNIEEKFQLYKAGRPISEDFDLQNFSLPSYAIQCDEVMEKNRLLRERNRSLKKQIIQLKSK